MYILRSSSIAKIYWTFTNRNLSTKKNSKIFQVSVSLSVHFTVKQNSGLWKQIPRNYQNRYRSVGVGGFLLLLASAYQHFLVKKFLFKAEGSLTLSKSDNIMVLIDFTKVWRAEVPLKWTEILKKYGLQSIFSLIFEVFLFTVFEGMSIYGQKCISVSTHFNALKKCFDRKVKLESFANEPTSKTLLFLETQHCKT